MSEAWADLRNRDDDFHERLSENSEAVSEDPYPAESRERSVAFVRQLAALSPGLASLLDEHMKDFDEILPHLSFGDLTRYVVSLLLAASGRGGLPNRRELRQILDRLEEAFSSGDDELQELIAVSFLENLPHKGEPGAKIRTMLGPRLAKELRAMESWRPRPPAAT